MGKRRYDSDEDYDGNDLQSSSMSKVLKVLILCLCIISASFLTSVKDCYHVDSILKIIVILAVYETFIMELIIIVVNAYNSRNDYYELWFMLFGALLNFFSAGFNFIGYFTSCQLHEINVCLLSASTFLAGVILIIDCYDLAYKYE